MSSDMSVTPDVGAASTDPGASEVDYSAQMQLRQDLSAQRTAQHLASRKINEFIPGGHAEDAGSLQLEAKLAEVQQNLHRLRQNNGSFLEIANQEALAQTLAERLVTGEGGGEALGPDTFDENNDPPDSYENGFDAANELKGKYSPDSVDQTLAWAAEGLSPEVVETFNAHMAKNDEQAYAAFEQLRQVQQHPELLTTDPEEFSAITPDLVNELESQFGEAGKTLGLISFGIANGKLTRGAAAQAVMRDPELAQVAMTAARQGLIKLAL